MLTRRLFTRVSGGKSFSSATPPRDFRIFDSARHRPAVPARAAHGEARRPLGSLLVPLAWSFQTRAPLA